MQTQTQREWIFNVAIRANKATQNIHGDGMFENLNPPKKKMSGPKNFDKDNIIKNCFWLYTHFMIKSRLFLPPTFQFMFLIYI